MWPNPCSGFSDQISAMSAGVLDTSLTCFPPEYPWSDRSSHQRCSVKKGVLREISSKNSQENTCVKVAFLITFTAQKMKFSPVNVTKSAVSGGFGHIYWRNPYWKTSFFVQCLLILKKRPWHRRFPVNFAKFFKNSFFIEHLQTTAFGQDVRKKGKQTSLSKGSVLVK